MAEPIEVPFGIWTQLVHGNIVLYGCAHWRHLANTIETSLCGGDAAFLLNYFDHLLLFIWNYYSTEIQNIQRYRK